MKSPITGKEMKLYREHRSLVFRKETFQVIYHFYRCEDSGEQFTDTQLDELNLLQVHQQFRERHHLPFPEEIISIRKQYGVPASKMSLILGFGINSYRQYEQGEVPSIANGRLIRLAADPKQFQHLVELTDALNPPFKKRLLKKIENICLQEHTEKLGIAFSNYLLNNLEPDHFTGYRVPSLDRFAGMVIYFAQKLQPWKTQLNKLMFYADFMAYRQTCQSISGMRYRAIDMGPVPYNYNSIYEWMQNEGYVNVQITTFPNAGIGERFLANPEHSFPQELFTDQEIQFLQTVCQLFKHLSTKELISKSHEEPAWSLNQEQRSLISYEKAFELKQI